LRCGGGSGEPINPLDLPPAGSAAAGLGSVGRSKRIERLSEQVEQAASGLPSSRLSGWLSPMGGLQIAGLLLLAAAYRDLLGLGQHYQLSKDVEYWLFRPSDSAPLVIVGLSVWLLYRRWDRVQALSRQPTPWALVVPCVAAAVAVYGWATYTGAADLKAISLMLNVAALALAWWGVAGVRALWLPIVFLLFAIPMPAPLLLAVVWKLQVWTAEYAGWLLYMIREPALVSGDQILRATQTFQVIEGCSGLRFVETLTMLTVLLIDLFRRSGWHALLLFALAPFVAFALNGVRVLTLILNPHSEVASIHNLQGIVVLLGGLILIYLLDGAIEKARGIEPSFPPSLRAGAAYVPSSADRSRVALLLGVGLLAIGIGRFGPVWQDSTLMPPVFQAVDGALEEWPSEKLQPDYMFMGSARFYRYVSRTYQVDGRSVAVFVGSSNFSERGGSPLSPNTQFPGSGFVVRESTTRTMEPDGRVVGERVLMKGKQRLLVQHFYDGALGLPAETLRSFLALERSRFRRPRPVIVVRLATKMIGRGNDELLAAERRLERVYERLGPALRDLGVAAELAAATPP
jgi:exosortase